MRWGNILGLGLAATLLGACSLWAHQGYHRSGNGVAFGDVIGGVYPVPPITSLTFMPGVDAQTFVQIDDNYAKDKNRVYFRGRVLRGADPQTFRLLSDDYSVDRAGVYWQDRLMDGVRPDRVQILRWCASDGESWWFAGQKDEGALCSRADAATFIVLDNEGIFGKDRSHAFYRGEVIPGADSATFEPLNGSRWFSKDNAVVFFRDEPIPNADPETFKPLSESGYGADAKNAYWQTELLVGADVGTFAHVEDDWARDATFWWQYGQKKENGPKE